jgi:hypothetical protein
MKKLIAVAFVLLVAMSVSADPIDIGAFPVGRWLDPNYNAIWDFSMGNIRILDSRSGAVVYDFSQKTVQEFSVFIEANAPGITFSCPESERKYRFMKPIVGNEVVMTIDRTLYMPDFPIYTITMQKQ